jgi:hypothetical protein
MQYVLAFITASAVLGPLFGADSRDGLDWKPGNFWLRRRQRPARTRSARIKSAGSRAPRDEGHAAAAPCRSVPAAG